MTTDTLHTGALAQDDAGRSFMSQLRALFSLGRWRKHRVTDNGLDVNFTRSAAFLKKHGAKNAEIIGSAARNVRLRTKD